MNRLVFQAALLLMGSGFCALVYQTVWFRLLRSVFGGTTAATSAVLAIFMGGLGLGSWWLGSRVERSSNPLALYARLEAGIAIGAAVTPWLIMLAADLYLATGGSTTLGGPLSTAVRLGLSCVALGLPASLALAHYVRGQLFGVSFVDPASLALAALCLGGAASLAAFMPARRASRLDPTVALRCE